VGRTAKYSRHLAGGERETRPGDECAEGAFEGENKRFLLVERVAAMPEKINSETQTPSM